MRTVNIVLTNLSPVYDCGNCGEHNATKLSVDCTDIIEASPSFLVAVFRNELDETMCSERYDVSSLSNNKADIILYQSLTKTKKEKLVIEAYGEDENDDITLLKKSSVINLSFDGSLSSNDVLFDDNINGIYKELIEMEADFQEGLETLDGALDDIDNLSITASRVTGGVQITVTDKQGNSSTVTVNDGATGAQGATGATGATGANGKSAYQVAVDNGFEGTEAQWIASLVGATGATGATGAPGQDGADGLGLSGALSEATNVGTLLSGIYIVDDSVNSVTISGFGLSNVTLPKGGILQKLNDNSLIVMGNRQMYVPYDSVNSDYLYPIYITENIINLTPDNGVMYITYPIRDAYYIISDTVTSLLLAIATPSAAKFKVLFTAGANCSVSGIAGLGWTFADGWVPQCVQGNIYLLEVDEGRVHWHEYTSGTGSKLASFVTQTALNTALATKQDKSKCFSNVAISVNDWVDNATNPDTGFEDYDYKAVIPCTDVTASMLPTVEFAMAQAESGDYSRYCVSGAGTVTIYSNDNSAITIPLIKCEVVQ